jgi:hypothetical protein
MTFSKEQQQHARKLFIEERRQKAWSSNCNAEYIAERFDELMAQHEKMKKEDAEFEAQTNALDTAADYHTKDNREKRKALGHSAHVAQRNDGCAE